MFADDESCDVEVHDVFTNGTIQNGYAYDMSKTANITSVSPARGGTAGGTRLTIKGTSFGSVIFSLYSCI